MDVKNVIVCNTKRGGNTGFGNCVVDIGFIKGIWFAPDDFVLSTTSIAAAKTAIATALLNDVAGERLYPVSGLVQNTDSSESNIEQKFNDGSIAIVREGYYDWTFQFNKGAFCLNLALRLANGLNRKFFFFDANARLYGTDLGVVGQMAPITPALAWTPPFKLNDGTKVTEYQTRVNFEPSQINENIAFIDFKAAGGLGYLNGVTGLQNITLNKISRATAPALKIGANTSCGSSNLYDLYADALAVIGLWVVTNSATGNAITITAIAKDPNTKGWALTLDTTDPDYTVNGVDVTLAGPTELNTAGILGYEASILPGVTVG